MNDHDRPPGQPRPAELDMPGPRDPVAWSYVQPGTDVVGRDGTRLGRVGQMLGTEAEGIFHGIALAPAAGGETRMIPASAVEVLTPTEVRVDLSTADLPALEVYRERF